MEDMAACAACKVDLQEHSGRGENTCSKCKKVLCSSCYGLKMKLEISASRNSRKSCTSCQQLISIKQGVLKTSGNSTHDRPTGIIGFEHLNDETDTGTATHLHINDTTKGKDKHKEVVPIQGQHDSTEFELEPERYRKGPVEEPTVKTLFTKANSNLPEPPEKPRRPQGGHLPQRVDLWRPGNGQADNIIGSQNTGTCNWNELSGALGDRNISPSNLNWNTTELESFDDRTFNTTHENTQCMDTMNGVYNEEMQTTIDDRCLSQEVNSSRPNSMNALPKPSEECRRPPTPPRLYDSYYDNRCDDTYGDDEHYYRRDSPQTSPSSGYNRTIGRTNRSSGDGSAHTLYPSMTTKYPNVGNSSSYYNHHGMFDLADDEDLDELEDIPAFDDIPCALILCGAYDDKTLAKAKKKQKQVNIMKEIQYQSEHGGELPAHTQNRRGDHMNSGSYEHQLKATKPGFDNVQRNVTTLVPETSNVPPQGHRHRQNEAPKQTNETKLNEDTACKEDELGLELGSTKLPLHVKEQIRTTSLESSHLSLNTTDDLFQDSRDQTFLEQNVPCLPDITSQSKQDIIPTSANIQKENRHSAADRKEGNDESKVTVKAETRSDIRKRAETEHEKQIREKRLERFKTNQNITTLNKNETKETKKKPDNRDIAPNSGDTVKQVKSKAFKHPVPVASPVQSKFKTALEKPTDRKTQTQVSDSNSEDEQPAAMRFFRQSQLINSGSEWFGGAPNSLPKKVQRGGKLKNATSSKRDPENRDQQNRPMGSNKSNEGNAVDDESSSYDDGVRSSVMKLVQPQTFHRRKPYSKRVNTQLRISKPTQTNTPSIKKAESDDDNETPSVMKLVNQRKTKEMPRSNAYKQLVSSSSSMQKTTEQHVTQTVKQEKKNKNKNLNQRRSTDTTVKRNDALSSEGTVEKVKPIQTPETSDSNRREKYAYSVMGIDQVADKQHRAFNELKRTHNEDGLKCTNCGHTDCQGFNVVKMKELITSAKANGFEVRDVTPDGNCMFAAVVDQLQMYGDLRFVPKSLREAAVSWLIEHPFCEDGVTHNEEFLSEKWEKYLQRMVTEGEWGDHVILRAIVNVVGHIVLVLNVSGEDIRWTELEPLEENNVNRDIHLILGHVGEFHYTSLRPTDSEPTFIPSSDRSPKQLDEEPTLQLKDGMELLDVFKEDYIDPYSEMPVIHLSFLLKLIMPQTRFLNDAAITSSQVTDHIQEETKRINEKKGLEGMVVTGNALEGMVVTGSAAEGTFCPWLALGGDVTDITHRWLNLEALGLRQDRQIKMKGDPSITEDDYTLDATGCHIGYTAVTSRKHNSTPIYIMFTPESSKFNSSLPLLVGGYRLLIGIIACIGFKCSGWPEVAMPWKTRVRYEGWPSATVISTIVAEGCVLVPEPHPHSRLAEIEWKYSFAMAEKNLFQNAVSTNQKYCFMVWFCICHQTLKYEDTFDAHLLKNVFLFACERIPAEYWQSSPGSCVLYMFDELLCGFKVGYLPNYFIPQNNMIEHVSVLQKKSIENQLTQLRAQPNVYLSQINESLQLFPNGNKIIDDVWGDALEFTAHRSSKMSTLNVFVPCLIETAKSCIRNHKYKEGLEILNDTFQERLAVSTCDDSMTYQMFLQGSVSGLTTASMVWFANYADKQLGQQLSKTMIRETCSDLGLVRINKILPEDTTGSYGAAEVPNSLASEVDTFCHDFAAFLFYSGKISEVLPVLYYCHNQFKRYLRIRQSRTEALDTFADERMFYIYCGLYSIYSRQNQLEFLRSLLPDMEEVVCRLKHSGMYFCLANIYRELNDITQYHKYSQLALSTKEQCPDFQMIVSRCQFWPVAYLFN